MTIGVAGARNALLPVVHMMAGARHAEAKIVCQRATDIGIAVDRAETPVADIATCLQVLGWLGGDIVDRAAGRVLAEQGALRPLQDLDTLKVERSVRAQNRERQRGLIKIDADRRIDAQRAFLKANAAQGKDRRVGRACRIGEAGDDRRDVLQRDDPALLKRFATECGNRQTNVIEVLFALVCGHHDLVDVDAGVLGAGVLGAGALGTGVLSAGVLGTGVLSAGGLRKCGTGAAHRGKRDQRRIQIQAAL